MSIKLHAYIAQQGITSRRKAEAMIATGKVKVNNKKAHIGQRIDTEKDTITIKGKPLSQTKVKEFEYYLIDKPIGYVSTTNDPKNRPTVLKLLPSTKARLYPVGRLDKDSQGLMLLTNDGRLTYKMTHPKFGYTKTYYVRTKQPATRRGVERLIKGVKLSDGLAKPKNLEKINSKEFYITLVEGKNREVRRMFKSINCEITTLIRIQFGPFSLEELQERKCKKLSQTEVRKRIKSQKIHSHQSLKQKA